MKETLENIEIEIDATKFLSSILEKSTVLSSRIDDQLNILLGLGTAIFIFSASKIDWATNYWWITLACFSASSVIIGLFAVHPPRFISQVGQSESLFYNKNIAGKFKNPEEYAKKLLHAMTSKEELVRQYATEVFNVYKYYYGPKRQLFKKARFMLVVGIVLALSLFLIDKMF